ncbi:ankyrin repeat domain-containing protein [Halarcobacter sp.]|uniref:ankyrin repeat domain-containing protein n=1 Tax=Halarcobacter sp. TaxID=2321133 RepID=UPI002AABC0DE|nr:ankyrin repeat domain-containing protein [Halarcobacter sp.]
MKQSLFGLIGISLFFFGLLSGKVFFKPEIIAKDENRNLVQENKILEKSISNEEKDLAIKIVDNNKVNLPIFIKNTIKSYGIDSENLSEEDWNNFLLQLKKDNLNTLLDEDVNGSNLLHIAVKSGSMAMTKKLLDLGYDVNVKDKYGNTPLIYASKDSNNLNLIKELINNGADIFTNYYNKTPDVLTNALRSGKWNTELVSYLKEQGLEFKKKHLNELTYDYNKEYLYEHLQSIGINPQVSEGRSYFEQLLKNNTSNDVIEYMLDNNLDLENDSKGYNALHSATMNQNITIENLQRIINAGVDINAVASEKSQQTPIMYAVFRANIKKIKLYLENGADTSKIDWLGKNVYDYLERSKFYKSDEEKIEVKKMLDKYGK